jgi:hypothetical protein
MMGVQSSVLPRVWAPGARARERREAASVGEGAAQPPPLLIACMSTEGGFKAGVYTSFCLARCIHSRCGISLNPGWVGLSVTNAAQVEPEIGRA